MSRKSASPYTLYSPQFWFLYSRYSRRSVEDTKKASWFSMCIGLFLWQNSWDKHRKEYSSVLNNHKGCSLEQLPRFTVQILLQPETTRIQDKADYNQICLFNSNWFFPVSRLWLKSQVNHHQYNVHFQLSFLPKAGTMILSQLQNMSLPASFSTKILPILVLDRTNTTGLLHDNSNSPISYY